MLFGGLGAAVGPVVLGLDASLDTQLAGLPGQPQRAWDTTAVVAMAGEALVLLLWLSTRGGGLLVRATAAAAAGLVAVALLPLGAGPAQIPAVPAALSTHLGLVHPGTTAAPTPTTPDVGAPLEQQLAEARAAAAQYPTLADALGDGWTQADDFSSHVDSHCMHYDRIDPVFDPVQPEMQLFSGDEPDSRVVG